MLIINQIMMPNEWQLLFKHMHTTFGNLYFCEAVGREQGLKEPDNLYQRAQDIHKELV